MIDNILKLANDLDRDGLYAEADILLSSTEEIVKEAKKKDPKAKVRNRGRVLIPASMANDDKDHFPYNSEAQCKNMIARVNQFSEVPPWIKGKMTLKQLVEKAYRAAKKAYPKVKWTEAARTPGKG